MGRAVIHWSDDDYKTVHDLKDSQQIPGIHFADLPTKLLAKGKQIKCTFIKLRLLVGKEKISKFK